MMKAPATVHKGTPDFLLLILTLLLVGFGIVMVFSASSSMTVVTAKYGNDALYFTKKQILWAGIGTVAMFVLMNIPYYKFKKWFKWFLFLAIGLLVLVLAVGKEYNGAQSWLGFGGLGIQPTEFAKLAVILYIAAMVVKKDEKFRDFQKGLLPVMVMVGFIAILIMGQPDMGSCFILLVCAGTMIMAGGSNLKHVFLSAGVLLLIGVLGLSIYSLANPDFDGGFRGDRFSAFLNPGADATGSGYHMSRSLEAFGHGGLYGAGLGNSVQKLFYLPYAYNDFIFAVIAEELGFIGTTVFLLFYMFFLWRGLIVSLRCPDIFGTLVGVGIVSLIAIQALINMGGVSGAIPVTGVTLPFISYGGSSLLMTLLAMGILLSISREFNRVEKENDSRRSKAAA